MINIIETGFKDKITQRPTLPKVDEFKDYIADVLTSKRLTNNALQQEYLATVLKDKLDVENVATFANDSIALMTAIKALKIMGEVIVSPFSSSLICNVLYWLDIDFKFCDIDEATMNINADKIEELITARTSAIIVPHVFGNPCDIDQIARIANLHGLKVIYDASQAFGTAFQGEGIGNFGDVTLFGFHALELFTTAEGAVLTCNDAKLKHRIDLLKNYGIDLAIPMGQCISVPGINGRMNELQAALGNANLEHIEEEIKKRKILVEIYEDELENVMGISFPAFNEFTSRGYNCFVIKIDEKLFGRSRNWVCEELSKYNIYARMDYMLCSEYKCYHQHASAKPDNLSVAYTVASQSLVLPLYGELSVEAVKKISCIIKSFYLNEKEV